MKRKELHVFLKVGAWQVARLHTILHSVYSIDALRDS